MSSRFKGEVIKNHVINSNFLEDDYFDHLLDVKIKKIEEEIGNLPSKTELELEYLDNVCFNFDLFLEEVLCIIRVEVIELIKKSYKIK